MIKNTFHNKKDCDYDPNDEAAGCMGVLLSFAIFILALVICGMLGCCTTTKYVPVIEHHTDTLIVNKTAHDSIYVHDSTYIHEKGDTVWYERWHTKYVERETHDTLYQSRIDSIPKPYPVETIKEVEKPLSWWQKTTMYAGDVMLLLLLGLLLYGATKLIHTLRR